MKTKEERMAEYREKQIERSNLLYEKELNNPKPELIMYKRKNRKVKELIYNPKETPNLKVNGPFYRSKTYILDAVFSDGFEYTESMLSDDYFLSSFGMQLMKKFFASKTWDVFSLSYRRQQVFIDRAIAYHYERWKEQEAQKGNNVIPEEKAHAQDQPENGIYCRKCGKQIPNDSLFCSYCGEKVLYSDQ